MTRYSLWIIRASAVIGCGCWQRSAVHHTSVSSCEWSTVTPVLDNCDLGDSLLQHRAHLELLVRRTALSQNFVWLPCNICENMRLLGWSESCSAPDFFARNRPIYCNANVELKRLPILRGWGAKFTNLYAEFLMQNFRPISEPCGLPDILPKSKIVDSSGNDSLIIIGMPWKVYSGISDKILLHAVGGVSLLLRAVTEKVMFPYGNLVCKAMLEKNWHSSGMDRLLYGGPQMILECALHDFRQLFHRAFKCISTDM